MKKAFDQNVSRAKPRVRLSALPFAISEEQTIDELAVPSAELAPPAPAHTPEPEILPVALESEVKARAEKARSPKATASQRLKEVLETAPPSAAAVAVAPAPVALAQPPAELVEVQTPVHTEPAPAPAAGPSAQERREKLRKRLEAVRENPRPEPLPPTVAQAGVFAVERIETLQKEVSQLKALNLALTQDLEGARRTTERATEEARLRMEETRRLAGEMEARAKLLSELEAELASLEGERDEALLNLQESRQSLVAAGVEKDELMQEVAKREAALAESLSEEERLAGELEAAHEDAAGLRRAVDALRQERDTLARQVSELTRERADLLEARKALEAVHRALTQAVAR